MEAAVGLCRGNFLAGYYDDWIINERYRLASLLVEAMARSMIIQKAKNERNAALATVRRLLE